MQSDETKKTGNSESLQINKMRCLTRRIEELSEHAPSGLLPEIQLEVLIRTAPYYAEMGLEEPSQAQLIELMNRSFELSVEMLEEYWLDVGHRD